MDEPTRTPDDGSVEPTDGQDDAVEEPELEAARHTQDLLAEHVPLALLVDLVNAGGPSSEEILTDEGVPDEEWWEPNPDEQPPGP